MRFYRHKYLIFISFLLLCLGGIFSNAHADESPSTGESANVANSETPAKTPVCSNSLTDEDKKKTAQSASSAVNETKKLLSQVNSFVENDYKASTGACHFIEGSSSKWWKELFTPAVTPFNDHAVNGAKKGDQLVSGLNLEENVNWINDNNEYLDWNFPELLKRVNTTKQAYDTINSWQSKENGSIVNVPSEIIGPMSTFNANFNDCSKITKESEKTWKCYESQRKISFESLLKSMEKIPECHEKLTKVNENRYNMMSNRKKAHNLLSVLSGEVELACTCKEGTDEKEMCQALDTDIEEDGIKECPTLSEYQNELKNCILCNLMRTILSAVQNIAQKSFDALALPLISLLGIGFALYLSYITLTIVVSPVTQKLSALLNPILTQGFCVALSVLLLSKPEAIYEMAVAPIIDTGIDFGVSLSGSDDTGIGKITSLGERYSFDERSTYLKSDILKKTVGAAAAFNENAAMIPAIGRSLMCNAWNNKILEIFPRIEMGIDGAILYVFGIIISFVVGFYLLDACVQLGILCALMPFLIASWAFKMTRSYASRGWDILMNTFFNFVMMGVIIISVTQIMIHSVSEDIPMDTLKNYLNANDVDALNKTIDFGGLQMILLLVCCAISLKLVQKIPELTSKVSGHSGLGLNIGSMIGGTAMTQLKGAATSTIKTGAKVAGAGLKRGGNEAVKLGEASGALGAVRAGRNAVRNFISSKVFGGNQNKTQGEQKNEQNNNQNGSEQSEN